MGGRAVGHVERAGHAERTARKASGAGRAREVSADARFIASPLKKVHDEKFWHNIEYG
jgi:hypothetical protein